MILILIVLLHWAQLNQTMYWFMKYFSLTVKSQVIVFFMYKLTLQTCVG